jgi:hypothetical protein
MSEKQKFMRFEYQAGACDKKTFELALFAGALGAGCHH